MSVRGYKAEEFYRGPGCHCVSLGFYVCTRYLEWSSTPLSSGGSAPEINLELLLPCDFVCSFSHQLLALSILFRLMASGLMIKKISIEDESQIS